MKEVLQDIQIVCPRCGIPYEIYPAMSRRTKPRNIAICSDCGKDEALFEFKIYQRYESRELSRKQIKILYEVEGIWIRPWLKRRGDTTPREFFDENLFKGYDK